MRLENSLKAFDDDDHLGNCVAFSTVTILRFSMTLCEHPSVSAGVSVGLSNECFEKTVVKVDVHRPVGLRRKPPRWLTPSVRREILDAQGVPLEEIRTTRARIIEAQKQRLRSLPPLHMLDKLPWFVAKSVRRSALQGLTTLKKKLSSSSLSSLEFSSHGRSAAPSSQSLDISSHGVSPPRTPRVKPIELSLDPAATASPRHSPSRQGRIGSLGRLGSMRSVVDAMDASGHGLRVIGTPNGEPKRNVVDALDASGYDLRVAEKPRRNVVDALDASMHDLRVAKKPTRNVVDAMDASGHGMRLTEKSTDDFDFLPGDMETLETLIRNVGVDDDDDDTFPRAADDAKREPALYGIDGSTPRSGFAYTFG